MPILDNEGTETFGKAVTRGNPPRGRMANGGTGRRVKTYGEGRLCTEKGCETQLSAYNRSDRCSCHGGWPRIFPRIRGAKP